NLFSSEDFDDYTIDTDLDVGFTPGAHGVSASGAATYTVPIQMPSGTNGMEPSLSITYNSQGGNGLLGMGWNLAGLSQITRVPRNKHMDCESYRIVLNYSDRFGLDGQRLIGLLGSYGHPNSTYATKIETFIKVTSYGELGDGPEWFKVQLKSGITL